MPKLSPEQLEAVASEAQTALSTLRDQNTLRETTFRNVQTQTSVIEGIITAAKDGPIEGAALAQLKTAIGVIVSLVTPPAPVRPTPTPAAAAPAPAAAPAAPKPAVPQPPTPAAAAKPSEGAKS